MAHQTIGSGRNSPVISFASYVITFPVAIVLNTDDESNYVENMTIKDFCNKKLAAEPIVLDEIPALVEPLDLFELTYCLALNVSMNGASQ